MKIIRKYCLFAECFQVFIQPTDELKDKKHEEKSKVYPDMLKKLEEIIGANNGYLAAGKVKYNAVIYYDLDVVVEN